MRGRPKCGGKQGAIYVAVKKIIYDSDNPPPENTSAMFVRLTSYLCRAPAAEPSISYEVKHLLRSQASPTESSIPYGAKHPLRSQASP